MNVKEDAFLAELRATFAVEAAEHVQAMTAGLIALEQSPLPQLQRAVIATVFRAAHSLKGASRAVDATGIEVACQSLEDMFAAWEREDSAPVRADFDIAHRALDVIGEALAADAASSTSPAGQAGDETVRVSVAQLDDQLAGAEELLVAKLRTTRRAGELRELEARFTEWHVEWLTSESAARALRASLSESATEPVSAVHAAQLAAFLDWHVEFMHSLERNVSQLVQSTQSDRRVVGQLVDELLYDSKKLLLLPFSTISAAFPKLVRDLSQELGKEVELLIHGDTIVIDKRILEAMKDPLIHLLRNAVDHGIEPVESRRVAGKPPTARVDVVVSQTSGGRVDIAVSDDGAGIDVIRLKHAAIAQGLLSPEEAETLADRDVAALMLQPQLTTSAHVTRTSGRGLGLAIVREQVEKLGGSVSIESRPGIGTAFHIALPTMLATYRGVVVEVEGRPFVIPTASVECVSRARGRDVLTVEGRETISSGGRAVAWVHLAEILELPMTPRVSATMPYVIVHVGDQSVAFAVDAVLEETEVLVKRLHQPLVRVRNVLAVTVLASGEIAPILNVGDLLASVRHVGAVSSRTMATVPHEKTKSVLVAEDSITSRLLLKSILENAGYQVRTAVDGMQALTLLRVGHFDVLVSDVEMPRLSGIELTMRIRADARLASLPVVLVTALDSQADRERGVEAGANAYIVKSRFDQSDLIDAIRRLV